MVQDSGNGLLETTLCFEHAEQRTFRTYYIIADNTLGRRAEAVELHPGRRIATPYCLYDSCCNAGQRLQRRGASIGARDLLQWAVGLQRRQQDFVLKAEVTASCVQLASALVSPWPGCRVHVCI